MSTKSNSKNGQGDSAKKLSKRPATSPLSNTVSTHSTGSTGQSAEQIKKSKQTQRTQQSGSPVSECESVSDILQSAHTQLYHNMAYPSPVPSSYPMQAPPYVQGSPQSSQTSPYPYAPPVAPPPWALQLLEEMKSVQEKLKSIDKIERMVESINTKMYDMERKMQNMDIRVSDTEKSCEFLEDQFERNKNEIKDVKAQIHKTRSVCEKVERGRQRVEELDSKVLDLESRSMQENLLFYDIPEGGDSENCETKVKDVIKNVLQVDGPKTDGMLFDRVHRLGRRWNKARPIVVKFHYYHDRETVRKASYDKADALKAARVGVGPQIPKEIREARKPLYPAMRAAKDKGQNVRFVGKNLFINNVKYTPPPPAERME